MNRNDSSRVDEVDYPVRDGRLIGETPCHRDNLAESLWSLQSWYGEHEGDVCVLGNMFVYFVEGNPELRVAPDVFVALGVPARLRDCYKVWEEPKPTLDLVIEFTSRSTKDEDLRLKFKVYRDDLSVKEYLLFDPFCEYLDPPQQLYRLLNGDYERVKPVGGRLPSEVLGLHFDREKHQLRFWYPKTKSWLLTTTEIWERNRLLQTRIDERRAELDALKRRVVSSDDNGGE